MPRGTPEASEAAARAALDPAIAELLPKLPLREAASLTPQGAREQLRALAASRADIPLPQPAAVADITVAGAAGFAASSASMIPMTGSSNT